jgi:PST family polysaccharide transporter
MGSSHHDPGAGAGAEPDDDIAGAVRRGLLWSTMNSMVLRLGSLVVGMVLARLLAPEAFGVYAIALTVQSVLMTLADLGMSVDLVRAEDPVGRAPTVATLSLLSGVVLALTMSATAAPVAMLLKAPDASGVIVVLSWTLVVSGAGVVPYAKLQRDFAQRKLFACSGADFLVGTGVTLGLILLGMGPMALAIGRVVAQLTSTSLQFALARVRPRFGFDRAVARGALAYGMPLAGANLLSWALLNIDNVAIARVAGTTALGLYVLAFNISSWPMSAIGQAVRGVSLAGFSRASRREGDGGLGTALSLTWAVALPVGVLLAALAHPLVVLLYGARWSPSAGVLAALGVFGALRVALDLIATYLMARGAARPVLYVQILWFVGLIPAVVLATRWKGITGAGWSHLAVAALVILPAYAVALRRAGIPVRLLARAMWLPAVAGVPTWLVAHAVATEVHGSLPALVLGGLAGSLTYAAICGRRVRRLLPRAPARRPGVVARVDEPRLEGVA